MSRPIRVLVGCEFSGVVRRAFRARGFDAWSCDMLPAEDGSEYHIQGDVLGVLDKGWDLMIAHPPCTYLSRAGRRWWNVPGRAELRLQALDFFMALYEAPVNSICVENPIGYIHSAFRQPDQTVEPYMFGHKERKRTCLWLKGLPLLNPTAALWAIQAPVVQANGKRRYFTDMLSSSDKAGRARTFPGIAGAMADQWGNYVAALAGKRE